MPVVVDDFQDFIVQRYHRLRLVGPAHFADRVIAYYKALGWEHILTGPATRPGGGIDARSFVIIFEKEDNQ